ncbi:MAG TPA: hypothetical protein VFZ00_17840, partial [Solirubrobacter sp.]|nr:hypothetical protein [Solirubrobacter sp.]
MPNALRLGGRPAGDYVTKDAVPPTVLPAPGPAPDSAKLGGEDPSAYLAADATAADAAKLGGKDPSDYLPGHGQSRRRGQARRQGCDGIPRIHEGAGRRPGRARHASAQQRDGQHA